jgi:hypothetical protein
MAYISQSDLTNYIDAVNLSGMLDDYALGPDNTTFSSTILGNILQLSSDKTDALVSSIYSTPFQTPVPVKIRTASAIFACEMLYQRRLVSPEQNPFTEQANYWRKTLMLVNSGELSLDANVRREFAPILINQYCSRVNTNFF